MYVRFEIVKIYSKLFLLEKYSKNEFPKTFCKKIIRLSLNSWLKIINRLVFLTTLLVSASVYHSFRRTFSNTVFNNYKMIPFKSVPSLLNTNP